MVCGPHFHGAPEAPRKPQRRGLGTKGLCLLGQNELLPTSGPLHILFLCLLLEVLGPCTRNGERGGTSRSSVKLLVTRPQPRGTGRRDGDPQTMARKGHPPNARGRGVTGGWDASRQGPDGGGSALLGVPKPLSGEPSLRQQPGGGVGAAAAAAVSPLEEARGRDS